VCLHELISCNGLRSILQLADDDSTSTLSLEKKREKMKTLAAAGLFILRVCWSGRVAGKFCGAVGMPSSRGSLDRACVGVGRGSPRPTSGSARYISDWVLNHAYAEDGREVSGTDSGILI
jgi:hypothetical protein